MQETSNALLLKVRIDGEPIGDANNGYDPYQVYMNLRDQGEQTKSGFQNGQISTKETVLGVNYTVYVGKQVGV